MTEPVTSRSVQPTDTGRLSLRTTAGAIGLVATLVGTFLLARMIWTERATQQQALGNAQGHARRAADGINNALLAVMTKTRALAGSLSSGTIRPGGQNPALDTLLTGDARISAAGIIHAPPRGTSAAPGTVFRAQVADRPPEDVRLERRQDSGDLMLEWFTGPLLDDSSWTVAPLLDSANALPAAYGVAFRRPGADPGSRPVGVVVSVVAASVLKAPLDSLNLGRGGYAFVFSSDGRHLSHPRADLVASPDSTVFSTAWARSDTAFNSMAVRAAKGAAGVIEHLEHNTGQKSWIVHEPIPAAGWTLAVVLIHDESGRDPAVYRHALVQVLLSYLLAVFATACWLLLWGLARARKRQADGRVAIVVPWVASAMLGFLLAVGIAALWAISHAFRGAAVADVRTITNRVQLEEFVQAAGDLAGPRGSRPRPVRAGLFINSLHFETSYDVKVSGDIWMHYEPSDTLTQGFVLPEAVTLEIQDSTRRVRDSTVVVGWSFSATLRQGFDYLQYPFDRQEIWVRIQHPDQHRNVVLVPDLASYPFTSPASKPGVEKDLILPGWTVLSSYFTYREHRYTTDFGGQRPRSIAGAPELAFNVLVRRQFLDPFVSRILPLVVVAVLLFTVLFLVSKRVEGPDTLGFNAMNVIGSCAALFFVVTFQHISLHETIGSPRVVYFEYFYFATYLALMVVCIDAILFATGSRFAAVQLADNALPKLLYWPAYLGMLFLITLAFFY